MKWLPISSIEDEEAALPKPLQSDVNYKRFSHMASTKIEPAEPGCLDLVNFFGELLEHFCHLAHSVRVGSKQRAHSLG